MKREKSILKKVKASHMKRSFFNKLIFAGITFTSKIMNANTISSVHMLVEIPIYYLIKILFFLTP